MFWHIVQLLYSPTTTYATAATTTTTAATSSSPAKWFTTISKNSVLRLTWVTLFSHAPVYWAVNPITN